MRISNDPGEGGGPSGAFSELFRLQADFQARLAEETLRYLRKLQGAVVPASPGTVVLPDDGLELRTDGVAGATAVLALEIENLQRVHCMVTPQLTPLISAVGVTWFPTIESRSASQLLPPGVTERLELPLTIPAELPVGEYRGALVLQGFREHALPVLVRIGSTDDGATRDPVSDDAPPESRPRKATRKTAATRKRSSGKRRSP